MRWASTSRPRARRSRLPWSGATRRSSRRLPLLRRRPSRPRLRPLRLLRWPQLCRHRPPQLPRLPLPQHRRLRQRRPHPPRHRPPPLRRPRPRHRARRQPRLRQLGRSSHRRHPDRPLVPVVHVPAITPSPATRGWAARRLLGRARAITRSRPTRECRALRPVPAVRVQVHRAPVRRLRA